MFRWRWSEFSGKLKVNWQIIDGKYQQKLKSKIIQNLIERQKNILKISLSRSFSDNIQVSMNFLLSNYLIYIKTHNLGLKNALKWNVKNVFTALFWRKTVAKRLQTKTALSTENIQLKRQKLKIKNWQ